MTTEVLLPDLLGLHERLAEGWIRAREFAWSGQRVPRRRRDQRRAVAFWPILMIRTASPPRLQFLL